MESSPPAQSILDTLRTVEFRLGLKGYNVDEVDEYLEKAAVEAEAVHEQLRQMAERLRQATERIGQLESERREPPPPPSEPPPSIEVVPDDALQRTLLLAQRFVDQTKRESEAEAAKVVSQAEEHARATVARADEEARRRTTEAEQRLREDVARLEAIRGQLAGEVEAMGRHLESERNRIRGTLTEVLKWLDENVQPPGAPAVSPRPPRPAVAAAPAPSAVSPVPVAQQASGSEAAPRPPSRSAPAPVRSGPEDSTNGDGETVAQVLDLRGAAGAAPPADRG